MVLYTNTLGVVKRENIPDRGRYLIDDRPLKDYGLYPDAAGLVVGAVTPTTVFRNIPARYGAIDVSFGDYNGRAYHERRELTFTVGTVGREADAMDSMAELGGINGRIITLRDLVAPGYWRGRLSVGEWKRNYSKDGVFIYATCELKINAEPHMYGELQTVELTHKTTFHVDGNTTTWPMLTLTVDTAVDSIDLSVAANDWVKHLILPTGTGQPWAVNTPITIDMGNGTINANKQPHYDIDITSDFWPLPSETVTITSNATTGTIAYIPEWSI